MKLIITAPTIMGGVSYDPSHLPQNVPDGVAEHLVEIGNARPFETKVIAPTETKAEKKSLSASPAAPALPKATVKQRRTRKPKSSL